VKQNNPDRFAEADRLANLLKSTFLSGRLQAFVSRAGY